MLYHPSPSWRNDTREGRVYSLAQIEEEKKRRDLANHLLFLQCQREGHFPAISSSTEPSLSDPRVIRRFVVEDGAWLHYKPTVAEDTILHYLIEKSTIEGVAVALKGTTAPMLDLTITGKVGRTPLHKICDREDPEDTVMLLEVILDALEQRTPGTYLVNWMQEDWDGRLDFLSYAASRWRLSFVWPLLQRRLPRVFGPGEDNAGKQCPALKIKSPVHPSDWELIPAAERGRLCLCNGIMPSPDQTEALQRLFLSPDDTQDGDDPPEDDGKAASFCLPRDSSEVLHCVRRYADVTAECPGMRESLLSVLLSYPSAVDDERGKEQEAELAGEEADDEPVEPLAPRTPMQAHTTTAIDCLAALLQTPHNLEITPAMLRMVCFHHDPATAVTVLNLLLDRILVAHPTENKNTLWLNFTDAAASNGLLSILWPVLRARVPFFSTLRKSSLSLRSATWTYDWNALDKEQQEIFRVLDPVTGRGRGREGPSGNHHESPETAALVRLVRSGKLDSAVISWYVQRGANLNIRESLRLENLLFTILENGSIEAVAAALEASVTIDFTHKGQCGRTILHKLCEMENKTRAVALLKLVVERIQRCPLDKVDLSQRTDGWAGGPANYQNLDFISMAAACGRLSLFWPVVQDLPFFGDRTTGIPLLADIGEMDWAALGIDEQDNFRRRPDPIGPLDNVDNMDMI